MNYVFYKGKLLIEYHPGRLSHDEEKEVRYSLPVGSYVYASLLRTWYVVNGPTHASERDAEDVPIECRTQMLLLQ